MSVDLTHVTKDFYLCDDVKLKNIEDKCNICTL